eukprot:1029305-Amphidinium_carterae.2
MLIKTCVQRCNFSMLWRKSTCFPVVNFVQERGLPSIVLTLIGSVQGPPKKSNHTLWHVVVGSSA